MSNILILGAGAAGLNAAHHLSRAGHPVTILEARDRIGGRIHTIRPPNSPIPLELGAEFVHGLPSSTWNLLHSIPATAYDIPDTHWRIQNSRITQTNLWPQIDSILQKLSSLKKHDLSFADFLKKYAQRQSPQSRQLATSFIEGFNATDSTLVSSLSLKSAQSAADQIDEMKAFRLTAGYDQLPQYLLSTLPPDSLRLSTPVRHIAWSKHSVHIHTHDNRTFHARAVIITVPLGVLQSSLTFDPPLPPEKQHALAHMKMGSVVKILVRFRHPFWEKNHSDLCFLHASPDAPFPTCWTTLPLRTTLLTGWAGGPAADRLANLPPSQILHQFLSSLSKPFNLSTVKLHSLVDAYHLADWQSDPFAGHGAYSYALVNGSRAPSALARPHQSTLFFAGEHTHPRETGTVAAALETGHRAAQQLLNSLPEP